MQMYKKLDVITNKHPIEERDGIVHHVMNHINWDEEYFIHKFNQEASAAIEDIHSRGKVPIVVGGTHYYLLSLLFRNKTIGSKVEEKNELTPSQIELLDGPVEEIFTELNRLDPIIAGKFHPQDRRKLRRALEIYYTTEKKTSELYLEQKYDELEDSSLKFNTLVLWVYSEPDVLRPRLDTRVDKMMEIGALEEIKELYEFYKLQDPKPDLTRGIWQVIGFKEFLTWLETSNEDFQEGVEKMKIRTRQYAKSQIKWIKNLLATELNKESRFNFQYGGKMYLLDATDLSLWSQNVREIGVNITKKFLTTGPKSVTEMQTPEHLKDVFPTADNLEALKSNKKLGSESSWKHFTCELCTDKNGNPFTAVGEDNYKIHLAGRRHKRKIGSNERKRKHEEMIKLHNKDDKKDDNKDNKELDNQEKLH